MRSVDLAVYADVLAAEAANLSARLERARGRLRQAAIEREAREALPLEVVSRLDALGLFAARGGAADLAEIEAVRVDLAAVERLQAWVEAQLHGPRAAGDGARVLPVPGTAEDGRSLPPPLGAAA
jgi:hypothetical protein